MGKLTIVDPAKGNVEFSWDPGNEQEVEEVKKVFEEHISRGLKAFRHDTNKTEEIVTFDHNARQIFVVTSIGILFVPFAGG